MSLPEKKCPNCNYTLDTIGDGIGVPDDYIPCEYCFLKEGMETAVKLFKQLTENREYRLWITNSSRLGKKIVKFIWRYKSGD